ncbi:GTP pyrophosphokinase family protein [Vibrio splendidus]
MSDKKLVDWYIKSQPIFKRLSNKVESFLIEYFDMNSVGYHIVTSRVKTIDSVREKGKSTKYTDPINQIQDFAGIRIITYVEDEITTIREIIENNFDIDEANSSNKSEALGVDKVGYQSVHYVAKLKKDRLNLPEYKQYEGKFFEIQIRTILQHAWAEIEHDRNYKFSGKLPDDLSRRFKILAGVLELADKEFNTISKQIDDISASVDEGARTGNLDIPISSTTLSQYLQTRFAALIEEMGIPTHDTDGVLIQELSNFGIDKLSQLEAIIPEDIADFYRASANGALHEWGMVRSLLILHDYKKFGEMMHSKGSSSDWCSADSHNDAKFEMEYYKKHGVDWKELESKYNFAFDRSYDDV